MPHTNHRYPPTQGESMSETPKSSAPERIFLQDGIDKDDAENGVPDATIYEGNEDLTWCKHEINDNDTEYVRADLYASLQAALSAAEQRAGLAELALEQKKALLTSCETALTEAEQRAEAMVGLDEVKQLCRDYSSRNGSVYIKDVESALDKMANRAKA